MCAVYYLIGLFRDFHRFPRVNKALILGNLHRSLLAATVDACMTTSAASFSASSTAAQSSGGTLDGADPLATGATEDAACTGAGSTERGEAVPRMPSSSAMASSPLVDAGFCPPKTSG